MLFHITVHQSVCFFCWVKDILTDQIIPLLGVRNCFKCLNRGVGKFQQDLIWSKELTDDFFWRGGGGSKRN